nr:hypothetical protein [Tanacetum cinerariifolium]
MVSDDSISREHPPGFTPKEDDKELDHVDDNISEPKEDLQEDKYVNSTCSKLKSNSLNSGCLGHFKVSNVPKSGGSILNYIEDDSVGNSGGILCTWDPNCLCKRSSTISDYFVIVCGVWLKTNIDILLVVVYAPHDRREKRMLWDYLSMVVNNWESLEEVPLGGSAYTWWHKSAKKMSKLDRFLISENMWNSYPNISAITLAVTYQIIDPSYYENPRRIMARAHFDFTTTG